MANGTHSLIDSSTHAFIEANGVQLGNTVSQFGILSGNHMSPFATPFFPPGDTVESVIGELSPET